MSQVFQELEGMLSQATMELFDCYGLSAAPMSVTEPAPTMSPRAVATIGFACEDGTRGNIVLVSSPELVSSVQAPELEMHTEEAICDILGELSNMLLGRLKNALLPRGVTLMLSTPTTAVALKLWLASPFTPCSWLAFDIGGQVFHVRLAVWFSDSFELREPTESAAPALAEGDMILF